MTSRKPMAHNIPANVKKVDYDQVAATYRARYEHHDYGGVEAALTASAAGAVDLLELGCGTGHWLGALASGDRRNIGLDPSEEMLRNADLTVRGRALVRGVAESLPFAHESFDFVFAVNALHHFSDPGRAIAEAARVLRRGGRFATVGLDPSAGVDRWYIYDYFPRALDLDRQRYPTADRIRAAMDDAGFEEVLTSVAQHTPASEPARAYVESAAFHRHATSQLSLLTDAEFEEGVARIRRDIREGERSGAPAVLAADLRLYVTEGRLG